MLFQVIACKGPTNTRVYTVAVYFRGQRLAKADGPSIQAAEMKAAEYALQDNSHLFPHLQHQKRIMERSFMNQGIVMKKIVWEEEVRTKRRQMGLDQIHSECSKRNDEKIKKHLELMKSKVSQERTGGETQSTNPHGGYVEGRSTNQEAIPQTKDANRNRKEIFVPNEVQESDRNSPQNKSSSNKEMDNRKNHNQSDIESGKHEYQNRQSTSNGKHRHERHLDKSSQHRQPFHHQPSYSATRKSSYTTRRSQDFDQSDFSYNVTNREDLLPASAHSANDNSHSESQSGNVQEKFGTMFKNNLPVQEKKSHISGTEPTHITKNKRNKKLSEGNKEEGELTDDEFENDSTIKKDEGTLERTSQSDLGNTTKKIVAREASNVNLLDFETYAEPISSPEEKF